ncbi:MAG TPA: HEAT repeat domain-containing protein [Ktedonobacteraceae bacterium]|nr:HEAT repeat domain-containing protein [Ktedonobacteraceae bacterium]
MNNNLLPAEPEELNNVQPGYFGSTPPTGQLPPKGERMWVDRPEQLRYAVSILAQASVVAIDAEFMQVRSYVQGSAGSSVPRLSLLQLAVDHHCFVVDTLRLGDLSPLTEIVANPRIAILLHGAGADMRVMAERGLNVAHYYDLEATSRSIFGQHESSLASMLARAFHMRLDKSLQRTDWTRRPLPPAMIAYAARDAEVTLALYYWLQQHYPEILQLHEHTDAPVVVAAWIAPFLQGPAPCSPDVAVADGLARGVIADKAQVDLDCRSALATLHYPMYRSRLLRLIADLSLTKLVPDLVALLQAPTSDERAGSVRALGRLGVKSARESVRPLLSDPVHDVRKAAQTALYNLSAKSSTRQAQALHNADGSRRWVSEPSGTASDEQGGWKSRLRSIIDAS